MKLAPEIEAYSPLRGKEFLQDQIKVFGRPIESHPLLSTTGISRMRLPVIFASALALAACAAPDTPSTEGAAGQRSSAAHATSAASATVAGSIPRGVRTVFVDSPGGPVTLTFSVAANLHDRRMIEIVKITGDANAIVIDPPGTALQIPE